MKCCLIKILLDDVIYIANSQSLFLNQLNFIMVKTIMDETDQADQIVHSGF